MSERDHINTGNEKKEGADNAKNILNIQDVRNNLFDPENDEIDVSTMPKSILREGDHQPLGQRELKTINAFDPEKDLSDNLEATKSKQAGISQDISAEHDLLDESKENLTLREVEYRNVEIVDTRGNPIGEFDKIQNGVFIEEKSAQGLETRNPNTGMPFQTAEQWAEKQIYKKTDTRIENIQDAHATRATAEGSSDIPTLDEIRKIRGFQFHITSDTQQVKDAVNTQLDRLRSDHPGWTFSAKYGDEY